MLSLVNKFSNIILQPLYCRARLFVFVSLITAIIPNLLQTFLNADCTQDSTSPRHFFYTRTRVPHARHACLVLDFSEPNCDWSKKNDVMEIFCGFVFADLIFQQLDTKARNMSVFCRLASCKLALKS